MAFSLVRIPLDDGVGIATASRSQPQGLRDSTSFLTAQDRAYHTVPPFSNNRSMLQVRMTFANATSDLATTGYTGHPIPKLATSIGDLNNVSAMRATEPPRRDPAFAYRCLAIEPQEDDPVVRRLYRPFLLSDDVQHTDWVSKLELATATKMADENLHKTGSRLNVLVLYGSLRRRSA